MQFDITAHITVNTNNRRHLDVNLCTNLFWTKIGFSFNSAHYVNSHWELECLVHLIWSRFIFFKHNLDLCHWGPVTSNLVNHEQLTTSSHAAFRLTQGATSWDLLISGQTLKRKMKWNKGCYWYRLFTANHNVVSVIWEQTSEACDVSIVYCPSHHSKYVQTNKQQECHILHFIPSLLNKYTYSKQTKEQSGTFILHFLTLNNVALWGIVWLNWLNTWPLSFDVNHHKTRMHLNKWINVNSIHISLT